MTKSNVRPPPDARMKGLLRLLLVDKFSATQLSELFDLLGVPMAVRTGTNKSSVVGSVLAAVEPAVQAGLVEAVLDPKFVRPSPTPKHLEEAEEELRKACLGAPPTSHLPVTFTGIPAPPTGAAPPTRATLWGGVGQLATAFEYDVALSFAGEDRSSAEALAVCLKSRGIKVFYDMYEQANLWGKDLYVHLHEVYRQRARFCVLFASSHYVRKVWTSHERQAAQARAFREKGSEYILPIRLDDSEIPGLPETIGYVHIRMGIDKICELLVEKISSGGGLT